MAVDSKPIARFKPEQLGELLRQKHAKEKRPFVTLLVGAGFSKSAGIPLAGEIVKELREDIAHPFLRDAGPAPEGKSEYAFLMEILGASKERANRIKGFVNRARKSPEDPASPLKINWSHLLLAAMVEKGYVHRILTTNFDPLIVEALAVTGQPIRTFDLNTTGGYIPGTLDPAAIIYLHGQMHSILLANTTDETNRLKAIYPSVLQESVQDSFLIVVGYSGNCDPVLDALASLPGFPWGLWWSQFGSDMPGVGVQALFQKHGSNCHLAQGDDADTFMRKLVFDGMKVDLPKEVMKPFQAMRLALERITPFPAQGMPESDPVPSAIALVRRAEKEAADGGLTPAGLTGDAQKPEPAAPGTSPVELSEAVHLKMAALVGDWNKFDELRRKIPKDPISPLSQAVGTGLVQRASNEGEKGNPAAAITLLGEAEAYGLEPDEKSWLPTIWGLVLCEQAKLKGDTPEADTLFAKAGLKYAEAVRIKPDMHEAFNNWGNALWAQAKLKGNTPEADKLFADAALKYAEAVRIKPDKHDAFYNWGNALWAQAKLKGDTPVADTLFADAALKYAEAVRIKPDYHGAFYNWGTALSDQAKLKGDTPEADKLFSDAALKYAEAVRIKPDYHEAFNNWACLQALRGDAKGSVEHLKNWAKHQPKPSRAELDGDSDFDKIRTTAEFTAFRNSLPE